MRYHSPILIDPSTHRFSSTPSPHHLIHSSTPSRSSRRYAIRESIELGIQQKIARAKQIESGIPEEELPEEEDPVPYIMRKHFEVAMRESRRSVSDADLLKYESFSQKMKQSRGNTGSGVASFAFPQGAAGAGQNQNIAEADDGMEGLYDDDDDEEAKVAKEPAHVAADEDDDEGLYD